MICSASLPHRCVWHHDLTWSVDVCESDSVLVLNKATRGITSFYQPSSFCLLPWEWHVLGKVFSFWLCLRVKAMVFPVVLYGCESWTIKKAECRRIEAFELWCWRRLLRVPWTARSNQSILKKSVLNIHWKNWCWSWSSNTLATWCEELTHWKRPWCWERLKAGEGDDRG